MNEFFVRHRVLLGCVAICVILVAAYFLLGKNTEDPVSSQFFGAVGASKFSEAVQICKTKTPFVAKGDTDRTYYGRFCLLYVACKAKTTSYSEAVDICRGIETIAFVEGDEKISAETCLQYIDNSC